MWGQLGSARCARVLVAVFTTVALSFGVAGPAGADEEQDQFDAVRAHSIWIAWADARPISPFVGIPFEFTQGVPFSRAFIDSSPGRSEAFAGWYTLDDSLEEVYEQSGYQNVTLARSNFPDIGRGTEKEVAPAGPNGPRSWVKTPTRTEAHSEVRNGPGNESATIAALGSAKTSATFNRRDRQVTEATGTAQGVKLGNGGSVGLVESMVKVEHNIDQEPLVTYRITLAGVQAGDQQLVGVGDQGITLAGTKVAGRDLADQFNAQIQQHGNALEKVAAKLSLRLLAPRLDKHDDGGYLAFGPVAEIRSDNTPRHNQTGDNMGLRLGYVRAYTWLKPV